MYTIHKYKVSKAIHNCTSHEIFQRLVVDLFVSIIHDSKRDNDTYAQYISATNYLSTRLYNINHYLIENDEQGIFDKLMKSKLSQHSNFSFLFNGKNYVKYFHFKQPVTMFEEEYTGIMVLIFEDTLTVIMNNSKNNAFLPVMISNKNSLLDNAATINDNGNPDEILEAKSMILGFLALESMDQFSLVSGVWRNAITNNKKAKVFKLNIKCDEIKRSVTWHFRQLRNERYYRGEHANTPVGSRWVFVAPELTDTEKKKHLVETLVTA